MDIEELPSNSRGGKREGAGRKSKAEEDNVTLIFLNALKRLHNVDTDEEAKEKFITKDLLTSQRGQLFVAEHLFGKAPQEVKNTNLNLTEEDFTTAEIKRIKDSLLDAY